MTILIKLFQNSKLDLIQNVKFVKQLFRIQIKKGGQVSLWNQVKSKMEACYSELVLHSGKEHSNQISICKQRLISNINYLRC